jgi:AmmeMemoRadiSam system protein A
MLTDTQKASLLDLARAAVAARVRGRGPETRVATAAARDTAGRRVHDVELPDASGVFVTIKYHGVLRGCLGTLENRRGLAEEVARCAADSASEDPRFAAVAADELPHLHLELSVLGPLERIEPDPAAFTIGIHGLVVEQGVHKGLLLPQVATEWGWTPEQFLRQTCVKAGLPADAWQRGADLYRFSAEVFGD